MTQEHIEQIKTTSTQLCKMLGDVSNIIYLESNNNNHKELTWLSYLASSLQSCMANADKVLEYSHNDED